MIRAASRIVLFLALAAAPSRAASREILLPAFPNPPLLRDGGAPKRATSLRLMRDLQKGGVRGLDRFDAVDGDYALFRGDSLGGLAAWLEAACAALEYDLLGARARHYDGAVFARMLNMATSLASLRDDSIGLAMPIGVLACRRDKAWGDLPGDGSEEAYVIFATDEGMLVYDPPTRQLARLAEFPNRDSVVKVWF